MCNKLIDFQIFKSKERKTTRFYYLKSLLVMLFVLGNSLIYAQSNIISGTVIAEDSGDPLPGVTILVKGTSNGAVSDFDGNYSIDVKTPNAVLAFSYVGFVTQELNVAGQKNINVTLKTSLESLDEVLVIGDGVALINI